MNPRGGDIHHLFCRYPQTAIKAIFRHLALHHQEFVFFEERLVRLELFVVNRDVDSRTAIVQRDDHHLPALGHLRPQAGNDTGQGTRFARRFQAAQRRARKTARLRGVGVEQMS